MEAIKRYIEQLYKGIPLTDEHLVSKSNLEETLIEKYEDLIDLGYSKEEASQKVIEDLGSLAVIRKEFNLQSNTTIYRLMIWANILYALFFLFILVAFRFGIIPFTINNQLYYYATPLHPKAKLALYVISATFIIPFMIQLYLTLQVKKHHLSKKIRLASIILGAITSGWISGILLIIAGMIMPNHNDKK